MTFIVKHYDPRDKEHYTAQAGNEEAADQLKKVLEHLGMEEVTITEEVTVTLLIQDARELNYWVLKKIDFN